MADNSGVLSQDAIDALLGGPSGKARQAAPKTAKAAPKGAKPATTPAPAKASRPAPATAGAARLEATLKQLAMLDEKLAALNARLARLEQAANGSPVFNLYAKFSCSGCGTHGAAQVRARCGQCGKEGWFGRKTPA